jgi:hypothetical protein
MDYAALKSELETDPAGLGYATMTPDQIRVALTTATLAVTRHVPLADLQAFLMSTVATGQAVPMWWTLKSAAQTNVVAEMAYDLFNSRLQAMDTNLPTVQTLMAQLVADGVLDQAAEDAIYAMADVTLPRGEALFGKVPSVLDIQLAQMDD